MLLFLLSFILVFLTSYFLTSSITNKNNVLGIIYFFIISFAQIVLIFEILSIFNSITQNNVLLLNTLLFLISFLIWHYHSKKFWKIGFVDLKGKLINSFKLDKSLFVLYIGFCVFIISSLILCILMPVTSADGQSYHVARSAFWVLQGNLNHFDTPDVRSICLPINSEILYSWNLLFLKKDLFLGFYAFFGYLIAIISTFNIMKYAGFCFRKMLWVIFILSSLPSLIVQVSGTETDIIIAGLIASSILLYWNALKTDKLIPVFMSALSYALALGTKTPAFIMLPGFIFLTLALSIYYKKFKPLVILFLSGIINFIIFASFNYILNYQHFGNFFGSSNFMVVSKNYYGFKGLLANMVKYVFMFFDFTGLKWADYVEIFFIKLRTNTLSFLNLAYVNDGIYTIKFMINRTLLEPVMGAGILGFLVFLPNLIWASIRPIFKPVCKKHIFSLMFAIMFIINIIFLSALLAYMSFSVRFVMCFIVVSSPVLIYSYLPNKNILKYIIVTFATFYLIGISTHLWARPLIKIAKLLYKNYSIEQIREIAECRNFTNFTKYKNSLCVLKNQIKRKYNKTNKILAFISSSDFMYLIKSLEFEGYHIDIRTLEDAEKINFSNYNIIIAPNAVQVSTMVKDFENRKEYYKINKNRIVILKKAPVPCYYIKNQDIPNYENTLPYQVRCFMTEGFKISRNLDLVGAAGIVPDNKVEDKDFYLIYENKLNRPIRLD